MRLLTFILLLATLVSATAQVRSGKASADWISESSGYLAGKPIRTAIVLEADEGWHTYWTNPGESGMRTEMDFQLPEGWKLVEIGNPPPVRFVASGLVSYGYAGRVLFPVTLLAPEDGQQEVSLKVQVSWLACDDSGCIPGEADLTLDLKPNLAEPSRHKGEIEEAVKSLPQPNQGIELKITDLGKSLKLVLSDSAGCSIDPAVCEVYPVSPDRVSPKSVIRFEKSGSQWIAEVSKSEYLSGELSDLKLVLVDRGKGKSALVEWSKAGG